MNSELPENLPPQTRRSYSRFLGEVLASRKALEKRIGSYLKTVVGHPESNDAPDIEAAKRLAGALSKLVKACDIHCLLHVQAAVSYFVDHDDAEHDLRSPHGFVDDIEVFNAVCDHVGCEDFKIEP